ncbi:H+-ATPase G subunit-domain-containing protein [Protomyces lactucae-debilis]|uniref:V-type proton ATPase subunit G n=1 Tax=Protomyces lactucae-debilis TaxID=2754530 RepID=A0A1Y2F0H3_PROLT|nr:H+-ATPase G subunit-domain-containing protein [Protomyces lactucae-debilis]ORY77401.1 H+-ATPase G subunit-domain-containing protein [Protomyces lactucae-debilis]
MSSQTQTASIQTLLEAEKDAQAIVEKARTYRTQRLKDARSEAAKEVDAYKKKKEQEYKDYESENTGSSEDAEKQAEKAIIQQLEEIEKSHKEGKQAIVDNLLASIVKSDPQMHINAIKI